MRFVYHPDPGPRPRYQPGLTDEQYAEYRRSLMVWESGVIGYGLQQVRLDRATQREETRQDNLTRFGMDRVAATKVVLQRKKFDV